MPKIKVVLADDHPIVLMGVSELIERDERYEIVGQAQTSTELIEQLQRLQPDIVVTDYSMPGDETYGDGVKLIEYLIRHFPEVKIVVLIMLTNNLILSRLYDLGVGAIILKNGDLNEISLALNALTNGEKWHCKAGQGAASVVERSDAIQARIASLSVKEFEVLRRFASGMNVRDIAHSLNRSVKTVSTYRSRVLEKMNFKTNADITTYALRNGLMQ